MDIAFANPCCRYPVPRVPGQSGHPCPNEASSPGKESKQLRVSTTFLENSAMRSLSTVQGQVFLLLQTLFYFGRFNSYLSTNGCRTNLEQLVQQCYDLFIDHLSSQYRPAAALFRAQRPGLSAQRTATARLLADAVSQNLKDLATSTNRISTAAGANQRGGTVSSAPVPPDAARAPCLPGTLEFHHIYLAVKLAMLSLAQVDDSQCVRVAHRRGCLTPRAPLEHALKVLVALKDRQKLEAKRLLREGFGNRPCRVARQIPCELDCDVLEYLGSRDSAWQFSMRFEQPISLAWLPKPAAPGPVPEPA
uniref:Amyloid protein-binding protein 2 n=1 Tax=Macrostomum lignano TaxID=282301 RepID=A0A1I8JRX2_9PLAT